MAEDLNIEQVRQWLADEDAQAIVQFCRENHPRTVMELAEHLSDDEFWTLLWYADPPEDGEIFSLLEIPRQAELIRQRDNREVARLLEHLAPDDRADVLKTLEESQQEELLALMAPPTRQATEELARWQEGTVGAVMSTDVAVLHPDYTAAQAIQQLRRQAPRKETIYEAYIVDADRHLIGLVSLEDLILAAPNKPIAELMITDPVSVYAAEDRNEAARKIQAYDLLGVPVLDENDRLLGLVTVDDVMDVAEAEATTDFHKLGSVRELDTSFRDASLLTLYKKRVPWLVALVFVNIFSGMGIAHFEETIEAVVTLVFFLPLLIASGGNAGSQSATLMIRSLATGDVTRRDWLRLFGKEFFVALAIGLSMAAAVALIGQWRDTDGDNIAIVVGLAMLAIVMFGSLLGLAMPFLLSACRLDPATASTPLVTSLCDIAGVIIYFSIATALLTHKLDDAAAMIGL